LTLRNLYCVDLAVVLVFAGALLTPASVRAQNYSYVNIDYPGENVFSAPLGVNDHGQVVGYWQDLTTGALHGYFYDGTTYTTLDYPGAATEAVGINNAGVISGLYYFSSSGPYGFIYDNGTFTQLSYPNTPSGTDGQGINNHNEVVGYWGYYYSFIYNNGSYTSFGYPGAAVTYASGINDSGQTSGYYQLVNSGTPYGFFDDGGTFTSIEYPGAYATYAYGINNLGVVVGYGTLSSTGNSVGFLWQAGQFTLINPGDSNPIPYAINNNGQIVGQYNPAGVHHGFLGTPTSSPALQFVPVVPCRLVDTRHTGGAIHGGTSRSFAITQLGGCGIPSSAAAYSLNVTAVPHGPLGYLTIWPTGESQPTTSLLNSTDGRVKADAAIVPSGTGDAVSVFVSNTSDVLLDINGYFATPNSETLAFYPLAPCRVADTRNPRGEFGGPFLAAGTERDFPVYESSCIPQDAGAVAYSFNFTAVPHPAGQELGYLTVWPQGLPQPTVSTLNNPTATVVANAAIVPAAPSSGIAVFPSNTTDLVIDINGYFAPAGTEGLSLYTLTPCRVLDTRTNHGHPFSGEKTVNVAGSACSPSSTAQAYVFNATVVPPGSMPFLTLWPNDENQPGVSTLNAVDGFITSNMAIVPTTNGSIDAYAQGLTQLILDISGYFAP